MSPSYCGHYGQFENKIVISYYILETSLHFWNENQLDYYFFKKINNNKTSPYRPGRHQDRSRTTLCPASVLSRPASTDPTDAKVLELKHIFFFFPNW